MNRSTDRLVSAFLLSCAFAPGLHAAAPKPLQVKVTQVNDRRTSGSFAQLVVSLELPSVLSSDVAASRVLLQAALDDTGKNLMDTSAKEPEMETNREDAYRSSSRKVSPMAVRLELQNPARKAMRLSEIRGEVELLMPAKDTNSVASFPRFLSSSGKTLTHKALKANRIEIALMSKSQLDAEKKSVGDKSREEGKKDGLEGDDLDARVNNAMESAFTPEASDVVLKVNDPDHRIQDISFIDKTGEVKQATQRHDAGWTIVSRYGETPGADWGLRVSLRTAKNTVRFPFVLSDIPLP